MVAVGRSLLKNTKATTEAIRSIPTPTPAPIPAAAPELIVEDEDEDEDDDMFVFMPDVTVAVDVGYSIVPVLGRYRTVLRLDGAGAGKSSSVGSEQFDCPPL
jgi:hypothetical protein